MAPLHLVVALATATLAFGFHSTAFVPSAARVHVVRSKHTPTFVASEIPAGTFNTEIEQLGNSSVRLSVTIPGAVTQKCYKEAIEKLSSEVTVKGFRKGTKIPDSAVIAGVGAPRVQSEALYTLTEQPLKEAIENAGIQQIGQAELLQDTTELMEAFSPGQDLQMVVKLDVWPKLKFTGEYTGLEVEVEELPVEEGRHEAALLSLRQKHMVLTDTAEEYEAQLGDSCIVNMKGYLMNEDGSKGEELPQLAKGDEIEVVLETGKYTEGLIEGLVGAQAGQTVDVKLVLPGRFAKNELSGANTIFSVEVLAVKKRALPQLDDEFASNVKDGWTIDMLLAEVDKVVREDVDERQKELRNKALEEALLEVVDVEIPETMVVQQARDKFAMMMTEMKEQEDKSEEEIKALITPENFNRYKEVVRGSITRTLKASLALNVIADEKGLQVPKLEIDDQVDLLRNEAKIRNEEFDEELVRDKIEATIQRRMVLEYIAEKSTINLTPPQVVEEKP